MDHIVVQIPNGNQITIDTYCMESAPCQHHVQGMAISWGTEIWNTIKDISDLETKHPWLWEHFHDYEDYDNNWLSQYHR